MATPKVIAANLLLIQLSSLANTAKELQIYAQENGPDGWELEELETVDSMTNTLIHQSRSILTTIGGKLKAARLGAADG